MKSLKRYNVTLTTIGPVHIGSGKSYSPKEFVVGDNLTWLEVPDTSRLVDYLMARGKLDRFEQFVAGRGRQSDPQTLTEWLKAERIMFDEGQCGGYVLAIPDFTPAKERRDRNGRPGRSQTRINELRAFIKDAYGQPYIPGSSLKGVVRSLILKSRMAMSPGQSAPDFRSRTPASKIENVYLRTLTADGKSGDDATFDVMRGIHISDSAPLTLDDLTVCQKIDAIPPKDGRQRYWGLPMFRESLKPGTKVSFTVTVDEDLLEGQKFGVTTSRGVQAFDVGRVFEPYAAGAELTYIQILSQIVYKEYVDSYLDIYDLTDQILRIPEKEVDSNSFVYLGAGSGFFTKTIWDELVPARQARMDRAQRQLERSFRQHHHENDVAVHGVSPRAVKLTKYDGRFYEMGKARITVEQEQR